MIAEVALLFQPLAAIRGAAGLASSMSISCRVCLLLQLAHGELRQTGRVLRDPWWFPRSCFGFISPRPLNRVTITLPFFFSALDPLQRAVLLVLVGGVVDLLADVDPVERRRSHMGVALVDQGSGNA